MRFSRAKPTGSFRVFHPSSRRVAGHTDTLAEARKDAAYWIETTPNPIEIQKRFPSGAWVTIETKKRPMTQPKPRVTSRRSHATRALTPTAKAKAKAKAKAGPSDKITIDQLAKLLDLPDWDSVDERNQHNYWEMSRGAEDEDAQIAAEQKAQEEVYRQWYDAVESTAEKLLGEHGLQLLAMKHTRKVNQNYRPHALKIIPSKSWDDAADKLRETINGVGTFHFNNLRVFLDSGPYTARQAVLAHLGYIKRYPAVYGGLGANQLYEHAW
jgi:hypothetical protein